MTTQYTVNYNFPLPAFDKVTYHEEYYAFAKSVDAILAKSISLGNVQGLWVNSTQYTEGMKVIDGVDGDIFQCVVDHTSAAPPSTFEEDRVDNPTFWTVITLAERSRGEWAQATNYLRGDFISNNAKYAVCIEDHESTDDFDADVTSGYWDVLIDASGVASDIGAVEADLASVEADLASVEADRTAVAADLVFTEGDVTATEADLAAVESDLGSVEADLSSVESDLGAVEADLASVEADLVSVEADLAATAADVLLTEGDLAAVEADLVAVEADRTAVEAGLAGVLYNVVEDTTPQLGGNLDVNGKEITSASNGDVVVNPNGSGKIQLNAPVQGYNGVYNDQTGTTYTFQESDAGKIVTLSNGSAITATIPNSLSIGWNCTWIQLGAGQVTFAAGSQTTMSNAHSHTKAYGQNAVGALIVTANSDGTHAVVKLAGDTA